MIRRLAREQDCGKPLDPAVQVKGEAAAFPAADRGERVRAGVQFCGQETGRPSAFGEVLQAASSPLGAKQPWQETIATEDAGQGDAEDGVRRGPVNASRLLAGRAEQAPYEGDGDAGYLGDVSRRQARALESACGRGSIG
ncbi:hypothetical protein ACFW9N_37085 [Streptomyces sp. NPDC059496]|uniref:hypothetical protein n=1 Tax=Streptomyces sp. NPDC059496 TaxID=3346851 RepID=UPI0036A996D4